ncbi:TMV resistance protein N-like protein [Tanacetum coccineum]|uniref:TMV resistance protein N-like protein n=1 Tax=Tanacetum coccineum TaxID=301880 RepID=A0ABQ5HT96_9ASTR
MMKTYLKNSDSGLMKDLDNYLGPDMGYSMGQTNKMINDRLEDLDNDLGPNMGCSMDQINKMLNKGVVDLSDPTIKNVITGEKGMNGEYVNINNSIQDTCVGNIGGKVDKENLENVISKCIRDKREVSPSSSVARGGLDQRKGERQTEEAVTKQLKQQGKQSGGLGENKKGLSDDYKEYHGSEFGLDNEREAINSKCNVNMEQVKEIGEMIGVSWVLAEKEKVAEMQGRDGIFSLLERVPQNLGNLECLEKLDMLSSCIKHLPDSICWLKRLKSLKLESCWLLEKLPDDLVEKLPEEIGRGKCLVELDIKGTGISHLPQSISSLNGLHIFGSTSVLLTCDFATEIQTSETGTFCQIQTMNNTEAHSRNLFSEAQRNQLAYTYCNGYFISAILVGALSVGALFITQYT